MGRSATKSRTAFMCLASTIFCLYANSLSAKADDNMASYSASQLYYVMCVDIDVSFSTRRMAAHALGAHPEGSAWIVARLADDDTSHKYSPTMSEKGRKIKRKAIDPYENAITASLIEGIPDSPDPSVLWGLTFLLDDKGVGKYSVELTDPETDESILAEAMTDRLHDLARAKLTRALGNDYGYDKLKWRRAIGANLEEETVSDTGTR